MATDNIDIDKLTDELFGRTNSYNNRIKRYFNEALNDILDAVKEAKIDYKRDFRFSDNAKLNEKVKQIIKELKTKIYVEIKKDISAEWENANKSTDTIVNNFFKNALDVSEMSVYFQRNKEALDAFYNRIAKDGGLNLSKTVWKYTNQFKGEIELALGLSLGEGKSAQSIARDVKQYLNNPDKLFRRVAILDSEGKPTGNYKLSKNAKLFHPGQGIYRSSYQNAFRLAATEVNVAYRYADFERWQQMDFVIGQQIKLSNNHTTKDPKTGKQVPFKDICDELVGTYPKTFKFSGWHPRCRCISIPILADEEDFVAQMQKEMLGEKANKPKQIQDMPEAFKDWIVKNKDRIERAQDKGTLPYFVRDNLNILR